MLIVGADEMVDPACGDSGLEAAALAVPAQPARTSTAAEAAIPHAWRIVTDRLMFILSSHLLVSGS
jgi:hypothetical protein